MAIHKIGIHRARVEFVRGGGSLEVLWKGFTRGGGSLEVLWKGLTRDIYSGHYPYPGAEK